MRKSELVKENGELKEDLRLARRDAKFWLDQYAGSIKTLPYEVETPVNEVEEYEFGNGLVELLAELVTPGADEAMVAVGAVVLNLEDRATNIAVKTGGDISDYAELMTRAHEMRSFLEMSVETEEGGWDAFWEEAAALYDELAS